MDKWEELFGAEMAYIKKLGSAIVDPHEKREFWEHVKSRKLADPSFSIYSLFPISESATKKAMRECCYHIKSLRKLPEIVDEKADLPELQGDIPK